MIGVGVLFKGSNLTDYNVFDVLTEFFKAFYLRTGHGHFVTEGFGVDTVGINEIFEPIH
jgi:hypothetical protein